MCDPKDMGSRSHDVNLTGAVPIVLIVDTVRVPTPTERLLSRFARVTMPGRRFIPQLDGMRFVAIGAVVIVHAVSTVYKLSGGPARFPQPPVRDVVWRLGQEGVWGVSLFFVISGFILALPFAEARLGRPGSKPVELGAYYLRRVTRLEPPYLIALTLALVGAVAMGGGSLGELVSHYAAGTGYLHGPFFGTLNPAFLVAWSLEVEVQFYLLVPVLVWVFAIHDPRLRRCVIVAVAVCAVVAQVVVDPLPGWAAYSLLAHIQYFLVGFLLADVYLVDWRGALPQRRTAWDLVACAAALVFMWLAYRRPGEAFHLGSIDIGVGTLQQLVFPALAFALFLGAFGGARFSLWLKNRWIFTIGGMCYSIYLTHTLVIDIARKLTLYAVFGHNLGLVLIVQVFLVGPIVLGVGAVFFVLIERPCMDPRWPWKLASRLGARGGAGAS